MSRWRAASIHLLYSIGLGLAAFALLFFVWYPGPLFGASGGEKLVFLLVGIDIAAGPFLTLLVYKHGKRGMAFDLWCIGLAQIAFLVYGLSVVTASRPIYIAFVVDRFQLVASEHLLDADLSAEGVLPEFRGRSWTGPRMVYVQLPESGEERMQLALSGLAGRDVDVFPKYYRPYEAHTEQVVARIQPFANLPEREGLAEQIAAIESRHAGRELGFIPVKARARDLAAVVDCKSGEIVDYLDTFPWPTPTVETPTAPPPQERSEEPSQAG